MKKVHLIIISLICLFALVLRIIMLREPMSPWWDPAIYVGMGKFLYSGGTAGMWEVLRPPLWPMILGLFWLFKLNALVAAQWIVALSAIATMFALFIIGEKQERGIGIAAALILALSPVFTFFVAIPTNDIPSALLALIAAYFILQRKPTIAGIFTALAFIMRFPHGLFLVPFGFYILIDVWNNNKKTFVRSSITEIAKLAGGFAILAVPYLIINKIFFEDFLLPLKLGREVIEGNAPDSFWYYIHFGILDNPIIILSLIGLLVFAYKCITQRKIPSSATTLSVLCAFIVGAYMSHIGHKELRYSFGFLPYVVILAAYGLRSLWNQSPKYYARYIAYVVVFIVGCTNLWIQAHNQYIVELTPQREAFYKVIPAHTNTITSSPQIMLYSDTLITGVFSTWESLIDYINEQKNTADYLALDSSQVSCSSNTCGQAQQEFNVIVAHAQVIYAANEGSTNLIVLKLR